MTSDSPPAARTHTVVDSPVGPLTLVAADGAPVFAPSFDAIGPLARTVRDCAIVYAVLAGQPPATLAPSWASVAANSLQMSGSSRWEGIALRLWSLSTNPR